MKVGADRAVGPSEDAEIEADYEVLRAYGSWAHSPQKLLAKVRAEADRLDAAGGPIAERFAALSEFIELYSGHGRGAAARYLNRERRRQ